MTILVVGATGMTGHPLVEQLLGRGHKVRVVVRSIDKLSSQVRAHPNLTIVEAAILDLSDAALLDLVNDCKAVVSCLGHVINFKGLFGNPRKLCTDATRRLCEAIESNGSLEPTKFILMNSVGVKNPASREKRTWVERVLLALLHATLPPHQDNETAAEMLHTNIGQNNSAIEWSSVRPDTLINGPVSSYELRTSPVTGIFCGRPTTRANVAHFMVALIENAQLWDEWKFKMPVIMNAAQTF